MRRTLLATVLVAFLVLVNAAGASSGKDALKGIPKDETQAVKLFKKAAGQGYNQAQFDFGWMYKAGTGVDRDSSEALKWLLMVARQGHSGAQSTVAWMYETGEGTP